MNLNSLITGPARLGLSLGARALGAIQGLLGRGPRVDDTTLQRNVEAEVMASRRAPKGKIEVSVTEGVVWLRGEVKTQTAIDELETRAASVDGVARVENLLRVAKPARRAKPSAQAKAQKRPEPKRSARPKPAAATAPPPQAEPAPAPTPPPAAQEERPVTRRFNADATPGSEAEPTPRELSDAGEGRRPAPLGAEATPQPAAVGTTPAAPFPTTPNGSPRSSEGEAPEGGETP
jgi:hypothetical protein